LSAYVRVAGGLVKRSAIEELAQVDAVIFDCDGVLIDVRGSYDRAVIESVRLVIEGAFGMELPDTALGSEPIYLLRKTGGFNNDLDAAWIMALWLFAGAEELAVRELGERLERVLGSRPKGPRELWDAVVAEAPRGSYPKRILRTNPVPLEVLLERAPRTGRSHATRDDVESVVRVVAQDRGIFREYELFKEFLGTGRTYGRDLLETVFDDLYYGSEVVRSLFGSGPHFDFGRGLYANEVPVVDGATLVRLEELIGSGRMGIVTGRDSVTTWMVLGDLKDFFREGACVFIADELRRGGPETLMKPSPYGLLKSAAALGPRSPPLYVGNSAEDLHSSRYAESYGLRTLFAAVVGLHPDPEAAAVDFAARGADLVVEDVKQLVDVLEALRRRSIW
jgi:phosphoglycolate phosphatase-like HAD superfamily hydrolase